MRDPLLQEPSYVSFIVAVTSKQTQILHNSASLFVYLLHPGSISVDMVISHIDAVVTNVFTEIHQRLGDTVHHYYNKIWYNEIYMPFFSTEIHQRLGTIIDNRIITM